VVLSARELDDTRLFYGNKKVKERKRAKTAAAERFNSSAPAASVARKAEFNVSESGARNLEGDNELVADVSSGKVLLSAIKESELPEELKDLDESKRQSVLEEKAQRRDELKQQIGELSKKRGEYLKEELAKTDADENSLDNKIYQTVRKQALEKGLVYSEESAKF